MNLRPKIALYEPDIPQNTAAIIRTCACLGADLEIIEPCGFLFSDKRFKRVVMDYMDEKMIKFYQSSEEFFKSKKDQRVILLITKSSESYAKFKFENNDTLLFKKLKKKLPGYFSSFPAKKNQIIRGSEEHTSELQSLTNLVCRLLIEKKKNKTTLMSLNI